MVNFNFNWKTVIAIGAAASGVILSIKLPKEKVSEIVSQAISKASDFFLPENKDN